MTSKQFIMGLIELEGNVIRCEKLADVSALRLEVQTVLANKNKYKEKDYKEIIARGQRKLKEIIGEETYTQMLTIQLQSFKKKY